MLHGNIDINIPFDLTNLTTSVLNINNNINANNNNNNQVHVNFFWSNITNKVLSTEKSVFLPQQWQQNRRNCVRWTWTLGTTTTWWPTWTKTLATTSTWCSLLEGREGVVELLLLLFRLTRIRRGRPIPRIWVGEKLETWERCGGRWEGEQSVRWLSSKLLGTSSKPLSSLTKQVEGLEEIWVENQGEKEESR